jgi:predicted chitinase
MAVGSAMKGRTTDDGGLPQTTGKDNYAYVGKLIGVDLVADPEKILKPAIAVAR